MSCYMYLITSHISPLLYTHVESIILSFMLILWNFKFKKCRKSYMLLSNIAYLNLINICQ